MFREIRAKFENLNLIIITYTQITLKNTSYFESKFQQGSIKFAS